MIKPSKEASPCLLLFSISKTEPGEGAQSRFWPWYLQRQRQTSGLQLSSVGRRQGPEKEERSDWRTRGATAEETDGEGGIAFLRLLSTTALPRHYAVLSWFELQGC